MAKLCQERASAAAGSIASFVEGIVLYVLSQQWDDLLSIYVFRLHPVPNCGTRHVLDAHHWHEAPACTAESPVATQLSYVAGLVAVAAALQTCVEIGPLPYRWHAWRMSVWQYVPRMIGMCIGWALGNAFTVAFLQFDTRTRGQLSAQACTKLCNLSNLTFCSAFTLATAMATLMSQPLASGTLSCGVRAWQLALGYYMRTALVLLINGLTTTVKIVWTFSIKSLLTWGVSPTQQGTVLFERALLLWAATLTFAFAALTVTVRRWRNRSEVAAHTAATRALIWRHALTGQSLEVLEATMGWTVGCAWTDALVAFTPLGQSAIARPASTLVSAVGVALAATVLGCTWLLLVCAAVSNP